MKKTFTLLYLVFTAFIQTSIAQTTTCNADFTYKIVGNNVYFTPVSNGNDLYVTRSWDFGDGSGNSWIDLYDTTTQVHFYPYAGIYHVKSVVKRHALQNYLCVDSVTKEIIIPNNAPCDLKANFTYKTDSIYSNVIHFKDLSTTSSPSGYHHGIFSFGDGTTDYSTNQADQPTPHAYSSSGIYTVCLKIYSQNTASNCSDSICKQVQVIVPATLPCKAGFDVRLINNNATFIAADSLPAPNQYQYHLWDFGDGNAFYGSSIQHYTYQSAGTYKVKHSIYKFDIRNNTTLPICSDSVYKTIVITNISCSIKAAFDFKRDSLQTNKVYFTNLSIPTGTNFTFKWSFGDGSYSDNYNPTHVFPTSGLYNVCLIIRRDSLCASDTCRPVQVQLPTNCNLVANFNWQADPTQNTKIYFVNQSTPFATGDSIRWTFGDGSSSDDINPTHIYNVPGIYNVCIRVAKLRSSNTDRCVKEYCKTITIPSSCNLIADFNWHTDLSQVHKINFTNLSAPFATGDSIRWTFGDGTSSNDINPSHTYTTAGTYTVCIRVERLITASPGRCVAEICKTITIQSSCDLIADFKWQADLSQVNKINFTNLSAPFATGDTIRWTFGDGTSSNDINPSHIYTAAGTYTVCIRVAKLLTSNTTRCVKEICKTITIQQPCNLQADFEYSKVNTALYTYHFSNTSIPENTTDSVHWFFGDNTPPTSETNPIHVYTTPGTYSVCLYVKRATISGTVPCESKICKTVVVEQPACDFEPSYSWKPDMDNNKKILFTNNTNISIVANTTTTWTFGDGTTATSWNTIHEYAQPGRYHVCLRIQTGPNCIKYKCDSITVPAYPMECHATADFAFTQAATDKQWYTFKPLYQNNDVQYTWTFGDGTGSHDIAVNHRYATPGSYAACLTVYRSQDCANTTCKEINASANIFCDAAYVLYEYQKDQTGVNKYYFYTLANVSTFQETWTITKLPGSSNTAPVVLNQHNPVYTFDDSGYYNVCVRVATENSCIKEYCNTIYVAPTTVSQCGLNAYPNPANTQVSINLQLPQPEIIHAFIYDSQNVLVKQKEQQGIAGNNIITINTENLVAGFYIIRLSYGNNSCSAKFQKL